MGEAAWTKTMRDPSEDCVCQARAALVDLFGVPFDIWTRDQGGGFL